VLKYFVTSNDNKLIFNVLSLSVKNPIGARSEIESLLEMETWMNFFPATGNETRTRGKELGRDENKKYDPVPNTPTSRALAWDIWEQLHIFVVFPLYFSRFFWLAHFLKITLT